MHYKWFDELVRISKNNSIMLLTSHGNVFKTKLTPHEIAEFEKGNLIIKGNTKEGHRTFGAFHPPSFMRKLFKNHEILEYVHEVVKHFKDPDVNVRDSAIWAWIAAAASNIKEPHIIETVPALKKLEQEGKLNSNQLSQLKFILPRNERHEITKSYKRHDPEK